MGTLTISGLTKSFKTRGATTLAMDDLELQVNEGELLVLLGPSGCGKTTTLRALAGLLEPDAGRITFGTEVLFDATRRIVVPPHKRDIGMVFQSFALWPHMTVRRNVAYPLRARKQKDGLRQGWVEEAAALVDCTPLLDRYPSQLSGGQQQRAALARALVARPALMLFDEPLSNLDAKLRDQLRADLHRLHRQLGFTGVYVTHDQTEALALGDRLAIMRNGGIEQLDTPEGVFSRPATEYVASFVGIDNVIEMQLEGGQWACSGGLLHGAVPGYSGDTVRLRVRDEDIRLRSDPADLAAGEMGVSATVVDVSFLGKTRSVVTEFGGTKLSAEVSTSDEVPQPGESVVVAFTSQRALSYGPGGELLDPLSETRSVGTAITAGASSAPSRTDSSA